MLVSVRAGVHLAELADIALHSDCNSGCLCVLGGAEVSQRRLRVSVRRVNAPNGGVAGVQPSPAVRGWMD